MTTPAGWYPDPYDGSQLRYWDGAVWTESVSPAVAPTASPPAAGAHGSSAAGEGADPAAPATQRMDAVFDAPSAPPGLDRSGGAGHGSQPQPRAVGPGVGHGGAAGYGAQPQPGVIGPAGNVVFPNQDVAGYEVAVPGAPWATAATDTTAQGAGLGEVGDWLSSIFSRLFDQLVPVSILLYAVPVLGAVASGVVVRRFLAGITVTDPGTTDIGVEGVSVAGIGLLIVLWGLLAVVLLAAWLAANHQLYAAHAGQPQTLATSIATAVRRLPRALGWGLILFVGAVVASAALSFLFGAILTAGFGDDPQPLVVLLLVPLTLAVLALVVWLGAKLAFFVVALAVGPSGTNPFTASWAISRGRFWPTLGRLVLLWIIIGIVWLIFNSIIQGAFGAVLSNLLQIDPVNNVILIDGQNIDVQDSIRFADFLPGTAWFVVVFAVSAMSRGTIDAIWGSGASGLYFRGRGPAEI